MPHIHNMNSDLRYNFDNIMFRHTDAIFLYGFLQHIQPKRIVEIGGGHTTALMIDLKEALPEIKYEITTIEPYPERLLSLLENFGGEYFQLIRKPMQEIELSFFEQLQAGDVLFVDSSHVSKFGSDVNYIIFEVLPRLNEGVFIHFHDIFYPFEYPEEWLRKGRFWTEAYLLRAFLQFNDKFKIQLWSDYLHALCGEELVALMPKCAENKGGSIWLEKVMK
jgi:predicted O-methyltransferase YrrM